jgi:hypothetical protein
LEDHSAEANGVLIEGARLVLIRGTGCDTAGASLLGCADIKEDDAIAGAELESVSEGDGNGVTNGAGLRLISRGGLDGAILAVESEVTGGAVKGGAAKGVRAEDVTTFSSDLRATGGTAVADGPAVLVNGVRLALAATTSRWTTHTANTAADSATPVRKAESSRVIRTFNSGAAA